MKVLLQCRPFGTTKCRRAELLIQEYMKTDFDVRTFVVDNKIFASTKRTHSSYDFRSNTHRGMEQNHTN